MNVSGIEEILARTLSEHFGELVDDRTMEAAVSAGRPTTSNALHVNLSRLRKRLAPLGLVIRRFRSRGLRHGDCPVALWNEEGRPSPLAKRAKGASAGQPAAAGHLEGPDLHIAGTRTGKATSRRDTGGIGRKSVFDVLLVRLYRLGDRPLKR